MSLLALQVFACNAKDVNKFMPQLCDVLLGYMQQNQGAKPDYSLVLRQHGLGRDAAVLSKVMSFPVGYDGHL